MEAFERDEMTSAERLDALLAGQPIDRVPFFLFVRGFAAKTVGYSIGDMYTDAEKTFQAQLWTREMYGHDESLKIGYAAYGGWELGGEIKLPSSEWTQAPSITRYPVESEDDVDKLEFPDLETAGILPVQMQFNKLQAESGMTVTIYHGDPFTTAGNVCGVDKFCRWMLTKPAVAHKLLRIVTDILVGITQHWVDTFGAENIELRFSTPTTANQIISPKHFKEFALPYTKELHEKVLAMGLKYILCHICGEQNLNLPYWAEIPMGNPGIVSLGHEVDLTTAIKYFGDTSIIAGNVEPAVIQNGTPQQVYELCRQCIEKAKHAAPRGYILMPGCELPPMAPPYNVYMLKKAINDFGWYP